MLKKAIRGLIYSMPFAYKAARLFSSKDNSSDAEFWDKELQGSKKTYLEGSAQTRLRSVLIAQLCKSVNKVPMKVLDIGCGGGELL